MTLTEIHIADIHFGAFNPQAQFEILYNQFIQKIQNIDYDILSINGDLFDHKFMANSDVVMYAMQFIDIINADAMRKNATVILLSGTESHDAGQLKLFYRYQSNNFIIVENISFIYVKGKKILAIPEQYGLLPEVYEHYLYHSGLYDGVIMHGTYKGSVYSANTPTLSSPHAPIFEMNNFMYCQGPIIAGHIHIPGCYDGHMYYCGSPLRYKFGEEEDKGFIVLLHNLDTHQYYLHFETIQSYRYDTINMDEYIGRDPRELIERISFLQSQGIHHLRAEFTRSDTNLFGVLDSYYRNNSTVTFLKPDVQKEDMIKAQAEQSNKYNEYQYIYDKSLSPEQVLTRYINQQKGYQYITTDELKDILKGYVA